MGILRTALYCRLSKDDMLQGDSESIKTQKAMLTQYAKEWCYTKKVDSKKRKMV